jgi:hypothetical protein
MVIIAFFHGANRLEHSRHRKDNFIQGHLGAGVKKHAGLFVYARHLIQNAFEYNEPSKIPTLPKAKTQ